MYLVNTEMFKLLDLSFFTGNVLEWIVWYIFDYIVHSIIITRLSCFAAKLKTNLFRNWYLPWQKNCLEQKKKHD